MSEFAETIRQLGTHRKLVGHTEQVDLETPLPLDAIIVPASRPAQNLEQAVSLARATGCALLILCSRRVQLAEVQQLLVRRSFDDAIVVDLPEDYRHELLDFRALASIEPDLPEARFSYRTDLSTKRNVGLILARMLRWQRIFFLDDDIRDINPLDLQDTVSMLGPYSAAGMRVSHFPDNSATCHAHRMTGGLQDVFISGAALAVDCQKNTSFFPNIYNEDWLFFYDEATKEKLGSSGRKVTQLPYNPFADAERAAWQEFGDVLAEGLYALLHHSMDWRYATDEYWLQFLDARRRFLEAILSRASTAALGLKEQLLLSVEMALKCLMTISPSMLEHYVLLWRQDLRNWQRRIIEIRPMPSLDAALQALGLLRSDQGRVTQATQPGLAVLTNDPPTVPFTLRDLYDLLQRDIDRDSRHGVRPGKPGGRNKRIISIPHDGLPGVRADGFFATARRAFRLSEHDYAPSQPSQSSDTQPAKKVCS
jgi:hypothetical protein